MTRLTPFYENVRSHYDLADEFFALFLDSTRTYSCAYFEREDMSLKDAQLAKIDLALGKCDLTPGMTLLDIGCGWGSTMIRAADKYDVNVIGLTLSRNQYRYIRQIVASTPRRRRIEVRLQGWEDFDGHADRIVSIGAFEHFRLERYDDFFRKCAAILPPDGRLLLHTIVGFGQKLREMGIPITREDIQFHRFILREIFPGGQIPLPDWVTDHAVDAGFTVERIQALQPHYARTLDLWVESLRAHRAEAIATTSEQVYDRYIEYLTGSADRFRSGHIDVMQFTLLNEHHAPVKKSSTLMRETPR